MKSDRSEQVDELAQGAQGEPMSARIAAALGHAAGLLSGLPVVELSTRDRRRYGGLLWDLGPTVAHHVGRALLRRPELFPEIDARKTGQEILERQERARSFRGLELVLRGMADVCRDSYLYEEGTAMRLSYAILERVIAASEDALLGPGLDHRRRSLCMLLALMLLEQCRRRNGGLHGPRDKKKAAKEK